MGGRSPPGVSPYYKEFKVRLTQPLQLIMLLDLQTLKKTHLRIEENFLREVKVSAMIMASE